MKLREPILSLLAANPGGATMESIKVELGLAEKTCKRALTALNKDGAAMWRRVGYVTRWCLPEHVAALDKEAAECHAATIERRKAENRAYWLTRKAEINLSRKTGQPLPAKVRQSWVSPERVPSIWAYAAAVGESA